MVIWLLATKNWSASFEWYCRDENVRDFAIISMRRTISNAWKVYAFKLKTLGRFVRF